MLSNKGFIGGGSGYWWHAHIKYYLPRTPPRHTHIYIHGGNSLWCFCMKVNEWRVLFMLSVKMNERERLILQQFPIWWEIYRHWSGWWEVYDGGGGLLIYYMEVGAKLTSVAPTHGWFDGKGKEQNICFSLSMTNYQRI